MNLKEEFEAIDADAIDAFIVEKQEEHLHLDFKLANRTDLSLRDDRKNLAKALSGFANSDGGIIVWGVEANDKNDDGIDCASGKQEISNATLFLTKLNEYTGQAVSPLVDGIRHKSILTNDPAGFAVTRVPASDSGPHMAKFGEDRYYKRSGDSFYKMEHFDLEDMFGRRRKPRLNLSVTLDRVSAFQEEIRLYLLVTIINNGRGSAKSPFLAVYLEGGMTEQQFGVDGNGNRGLSRISHSQQHRVLRFGANPDIVIHPGVSLDVTKLQKNYRRINPNVEDIRISFELVADGVALRQDEVLLKAEAIQAHIQPYVNA